MSRAGAAPFAAFLALAAALGAAPDRAAAQEPARGGAVDVRVTPDRLTLGDVERAQVAAVLPEGATRVRFHAALGRVKAGKIAGGRAVAVYLPPDSFVPQIDVVVAIAETAQGPRVGFAAIALVGQGEAVLKTRPNAQARITIGDAEYGPVQADKKGKATIAIEVPPGVDVGIDERGKPVDLGVPPSPRVALVVPGKAPPEGLTVYAVATGRDGAADPEARVTLAVDRGEVTAARSLGDGLFAAQYTPPADGEGSATITATVEGDDLPPATATVRTLSRAPAAAAGDEAAGAGAAPAGGAARRLDAALKAGFASNLGALHAYAVGADLSLEIAPRALGLRIGADVTFSSSRDSATRTAGDGTAVDAGSTLWLVPIAGYVGARLPLGPRWALAARIEGGAVLMDNSVALDPEGGTASTLHEREWLPAIGGAAEAGLTLGPGALFAEIRYLHAFRDPETVAGRFTMLYVDLGYRFSFAL